MAKLSQDKIEWILSLNSTQAQEQIRKLTKENRDLEKQCEAANKVMASVAKDSEEWKTAEANLKSYKKQIAENKAMLRELNSSSMMNLVPWFIITYKALTIVRKGFSRFQADSNRCERFCRPVPNHSDMEPFAFVRRGFRLNCDAKLVLFF